MEEILDIQNIEVKSDENKIIEPKKGEPADEINPIEIVKNLQEQVNELQDKLLRQLAEVENIRTRSAKMVDEARDYSISGFAKDMVPVMDNLSRALEHIPENLDVSALNVIEGVKMTQNELISVFKKHALEPINPQVGEKFDYHSHHAISQIVTDQQEPGTIVQTMQVGYKIKDRLIRAATVAVAKKE
ncbi:MAG: nucleotide exchange factor GrpE [Rickettsiales bacterium]|nr:MAG: nucleotide exchange factor GrpE [Rickettsiales bacterium]